jgi:hypothetical protein
MITMPVTSCHDCPFCADGPLLHDGPRCRAAAFTNDAGANTARAADGALRTVDADVRSWCPLMREDVVVTRPR